jgi:hypothetical protein
MDTLMTRKRSKRFTRNLTPAGFQLTDRDITLLSHVARHRFLSSDHLAKLDGGSAQNVLRSLRVLFDHQFLDRPPAQLNHMPVAGPRPMVYGLGRQGARVLREWGSMVPDTDFTEKNKRAGAKFIEHTLAIADFMVNLELACRERGDVKLLDEASILARAPERTRASREPLRLVVPGLSNQIGISSVVADGLFGLLFPNETAAYFLLELDRGSMPVSRSAFDKTSYRRKLLVYWEAWKKKLHASQFGVSQLRILTLTESQSRIANMLNAVDEITRGKGSNFFLFGDWHDIEKCSPFGMKWISGKREQIKICD